MPDHPTATRAVADHPHPHADASPSAGGEWASTVAEAATILAGADALVVTAGAGLSAESGLPVYHGPTGRYAAAIGGIEQASAARWEEDPDAAHTAALGQVALVAAARPHPGYATLARWADQARYGAVAFTTNTDGMLVRAGWDPDRVYEAHGTLWVWQCVARCDAPLGHARVLPGRRTTSGVPLVTAPAWCAHCEGPRRPNTLLFADFAFDDRRRAAQWDRIGTWFDALPTDARVVVLDVGTGTTVPVVRAKGEALAAAHGWPLVRINPETTSWRDGLTGVHVRARVGEVLAVLGAHVALDEAALPGRS